MICSLFVRGAMAKPLAGPVVLGGVLAVTMATVAAQSVMPSPTVSAGCPSAVELAKALSWPLFAVLIAVLFRQPLTRFFDALGARATKLSVFKVELELVSGAAPTRIPLLEDIQRAPSSAQISDSSRTMLEQMQLTTPADFAVINIGGGDEWLTSRLYIAAA